jgi:hypothetical protein
MKTKYILTKSADNHVVIMETPYTAKLEKGIDIQISADCLKANLRKKIFQDVSNNLDYDYKIWMLTEDIA